MKQSTGLNIKRMREEKGISRETLAKAIKKDASYIKEVEEREHEPAVSDLLKIANFLGTDISSLVFGMEFEENAVVITKPESRVKVDRRHYLNYRSLAYEYSGRHIEPFLIEIYEQDPAKMEYNEHKGEEFHYVLEGTLKIIIDGKEYILKPEEAIYFNSSLSHSLTAENGSCKVLAAIYNGESMLHLTRSSHMRDLVQAAKHLGGKNIAVVCPDKTVMLAVNKGIEEGVIKTAFLVGDRADISKELLVFEDHYEFVHIPSRDEDYPKTASKKAVSLIREHVCHMIMKGKLNTAVFVKALLNRDSGITTGRRLSLISIFELPDLNRLIFLTDPGINPELVPDNDLKTSVDIIQNAVDVAKGLGVVRPKVALLEANEVPSEKLPSSLYEKKLTEMSWEDADVYGPLSYDLALYEESVKKKGFEKNSVAGHADVLVVPYISGGNFLYKAWAMTLKSDVASIVVGARAPVIMTSRGDTEMTKFLTICACAVYSQYIESKSD